MGQLLDSWLDHLACWFAPWNIWWAVSHWLTRYVAVWLIVLSVAYVTLADGWSAFDNDDRESSEHLLNQVMYPALAYDPWTPRDGAIHGNAGHTTIDFGGQWLMGRMLVEGHGHDLYHRYYQREILRRFYPDWESHFPKPLSKRLKGDTKPDTHSDVKDLMDWLMGTDSGEAKDTFASFLAPLGAGDGLQAVVLSAAAREQVTTQYVPPGYGQLGGGAAFVVAPRLLPPERRAQVADQQFENQTLRRLGGPLYPPINAFLAYPLALFPPEIAYRIHQLDNLLLAFLAGLATSYLSRGRFWWPIATTAVLLFPGFGGTLALAQNSTLTLAILLWGWALGARGRPLAGGLVWALLAFKPVWAAVFLMTLLLTWRWRMVLAMLGGVVVLVLATLPVVGWQSWKDWLEVGNEAAETYKSDYNWIYLSRDLLGLPRRWLTEPQDIARVQHRKEEEISDEETSDVYHWLLTKDERLRQGSEGSSEESDSFAETLRRWIRRLPFATPRNHSDPHPLAELIGWIFIGLVILPMAALAVLRRRQAGANTGPVAAFLLLGSWLSCYHFMYYDVLLAVFPLLVLFGDPSRYLLARVFRVQMHNPLAPWIADLRYRAVETDFFAYFTLRHPTPLPSWSAPYYNTWVLNSLAMYLALLMFLLRPLIIEFGGRLYDTFTPWDTYSLIVIWLWCGWLWFWDGWGRRIRVV